MAFVIAMVFGVGLGVLSAIKQNTLTDHLAMLFSVIGVATPSFVVITLMVIFLAVDLPVLPAFGWDGIFSTRTSLSRRSRSRWPDGGDRALHAGLDARNDPPWTMSAPPAPKGWPNGR